MKRDITQDIKNATEEIRLTPGERERLFTAVWKAQHPEPTKRISWGLVRPALAGMCMVVLSFGTVSSAAERALPGDILYAIKVGINEKIRTVFASTPEARAVVETQLAERRLEEATSLAAQGKLTPEAKTQVQASFEEHSEKAVLSIRELQVNNSPAALDIASGFEASLAARNAILNTVDTQKGNGEVGALRKLVQAKGLQVAEVRGAAEESAAVSAEPVTTSAAMLFSPATSTTALVTAQAANRLGVSAEDSLVTTTTFLEDNATVLSTADIAQSEQVLHKAKQLIERGKTLVAQNDMAGAYHAFQDALVLTETRRVILQTSVSFIAPDATTTSPVSPENKTGAANWVSNEPVAVTDVFKNGVHTYTGSITLPNPCTDLTVRSQIKESFPEQIVLSFEAHSTSAVCVQVLSLKTFVVDVRADLGATTSAVFNGVTIPLTITQQVPAGKVPAMLLPPTEIVPR